MMVEREAKKSIVVYVVGGLRVAMKLFDAEILVHALLLYLVSLS
jgi:hypothetical protein